MFQNVVFGNQTFESEAQRRKLLLSAYLIVLYLGIDLFFFLVNFFNPHGATYSFYIGISVSLLCIWFIRKRWLDAALFLHLLRANALAFYFTIIDEDPYRTAAYLYFIPASLGAMAVYGYQDRWKAVLFTLVSVGLFLWALYDPLQFVPDNAHFYFIVNFVIVLAIGLLILWFFHWMVVESETRTLLKNKELEKANAELDRFVYSVSHDLRAPLSSIMGLVTIYKYAQEEQEKIDIINHIERRAIKLDEFIREILDYARNTRMTIQNFPVDIKVLIQDVLENLRYVKNFDNISVNIDVQYAGQIESDAERLKVIFNNLLSNAIKYQDVRKQPSVEIIVKQDDKKLLIEVIDNGIGIRHEHTEKVFEMFYRANDMVEGSGLGLYIVKETVESLNGKVELSSEFTKGTLFRIYLPLGKVN